VDRGKRAPARGRAIASDKPPLRRRLAPPPRRRVEGLEREAPAPLRLVPGLYAVHTQPGLEPAAATEVISRIARSREVARRSIPDRAGITIFTAPHGDRFAELRTAEDVFAVVGYRAGLGVEPQTLDKVRGVARDAPFVDSGLADRALTTPGTRAGRRLRYRVVARLVGDHEFRRVDLQRAVERGIAERQDHTWRFDENAADVEFWATMLDGEFILELRLSDERMRHREYKAAHRIASLRPSVAGALAWLSEPEESDVVLDPFCGAATILIERAHLGRYAMLIGSDRDPGALEAARVNVGPRYKPIRLEKWDAAALLLEAGSVSKIVTNLPWGQRYGSRGENRRLYPKWFTEFRRVLKSDGIVVALTSEWRLMRDLEDRGIFKPAKTLRVSILGAPAAVYVGRLGDSRAR
jgi:tRNA (guanine6-N2)-methyltransferase